MDDSRARYHELDELTRRVARAVAELEMARDLEASLEPRLRSELEALADRVQALQMQLANEAERAWNRAESEIRQTRRARMMGQIHDATTPEAPIADPFDAAWQVLGEVKSPEDPGDQSAPETRRS